MKDKKAQKRLVDPLVEVMDEINRTPAKKLTLQQRLKFFWRFTKLAGLKDTDEDVIWLKKELGANFRERRKSFGISQEEVGRKALVSGKTISNLENGESAISTYPAIILILEFMIADKVGTKEKAEMFNDAAIRSERPA